MKRIIVLVLLVVCYCSTFAKDYYVGGAGALDTNPGTATQPFATIQKAASVAVAGDIVSIRSGTYRETVVPVNSGTIYQPDLGATVIISGLNEAGNSGWTVHSGNIYKKTIALPVNGYNKSITSNTTVAANQIFKDGAMQFEARWPKVNSVNDLLDKSKLRSRVSTSNWQGNTLTDNGLPNIPGGWAGGKIYIIGWFLAHTTNITSHSGTTIGFNSGLGGDLRFLQYYYVTGKLGALTQAKEWHNESGTLYFWQEGGGPPTGVEYKARNWGFDLRGKSNITVRGLQFFGCDPINGDINSANTVVDGIKAKYLNHVVISEGSPLQYFNANQTGIKLIGPNSTIRNSELQYAGANAIHLGANGRAENNLIQDINYEGNYGAGVIPYGTTGGQIIKGNTMRRMGRACIDMGGIKNGSHLNMNIELNDLHDYGMISADGGAIYGSVFTRLNGTVIHHNWIHDCRAVITPYAPHDVGINAGIYQDQTSGPTTIHHNVFWNNYQTDFTNQPAGEGQNAGPTLLYNNTFATTGQPDHPWARSYVTFNTVTLDVQRNNIYRDDVFFNWILSFSAGNFANCLTNTQNPSFAGPAGSGLNYRLATGSMAINAGMSIPGITDGSVGTPDIGAYEFGGTAWVPGYVPTATTPGLPVTTVSISPATVTIAVGATSQLSKTISPSNATNQNVSWTTSNASVATVNSSGLVASVAVGTAIITVTTQDGSFKATSAITVTAQNQSVTAVSMSPANVTISVGATSQLSKTIRPLTATNQNVVWTTSNASVASVNSSGVVASVAAGTATITVTTQDGSFKATSAITVTAQNQSVTAVSMSPANVTISVGATSQLSKTISPLTATNQNVSWTTSNASVATVNSSGLVASVAAGSATITVTTQDGSFKATSAITVNVGSPLTGIDNAILGTGTNQHSYSGPGWMHAATQPSFFNSTLSYSNATNNSVTLSFVGNKIEWYTEKMKTHGIAAVSIDNGPEVNVDLYAATGAQQVLVYGSAPLTQGTHSFKIRVTGTKNSASTGFYAIHDFVKVYSGGVTVTGITATPTTATLTMGGTATLQLTKSISPSTATNQNVSWISSNAGIATVNSSGLVTAVAAGSATVTVTTQDGSFKATSTITVNISSTLTGIDNAILGSGTNQHNFSGTGWMHAATQPSFLNSTLSYSNATNNAVTLSFVGNKIEWYTEKMKTHGIAAVSIDNGPEVNVDLYAPIGAQRLLVYSSPALAQGTHSFKIRVTGTKNTASTGFYAIHDFVKVYSGGGGGGGARDATITMSSEGETTLLAYPNPINSGDVLHLELPDAWGELKISNMMGKLNHTFQVTDSKVEIPTADLDNGMYLVQYRSRNGLKAIKIIIK